MVLLLVELRVFVDLRAQVVTLFVMHGCCWQGRKNDEMMVSLNTKCCVAKQHLSERETPNYSKQKTFLTDRYLEKAKREILMETLLAVNTTQIANGIAELRTQLQGNLFTPSDAGYESTLAGWNRANTQRPAVIVSPHSAQDVAHAVAFARANAMILSVRSGGHNIAGLGYCDDGVMIDLSRFNAITIDPVRQIAIAQPGAKLGEFVAATQAHGLATASGTCSSVGLGGATLGGGVGWLTGRFGMTIDNVLSFEVVTADSRILKASATENPDLFWALRGGGGNYGVVTSIEYQLYPLHLVYGGLVMYSLEEATAVLRAFVDLSASAPDELMMHAILAHTPGTPGPIVMIHACYSGEDLQAGERLLAPLRQLGKPLVDALQIMPYGELFKMLDAPAPAGLHYHDAAYSLRNPSDAALATLGAVVREMPAPIGSVVIHQVRGVASRVAADATAFALREPHFGVVHNCFWQEGSGEEERIWTDVAYELMTPYMTPGLYVNFMNAGSEVDVRDAYRDNYERLAMLKAKYDPTNLFRRNQNILPAN